MIHDKHDSYDRFEEISQLVKKTHLEIRDPLKDSEINKPVPTKKSEIVDLYIKEFRSLIKESAEYEEEESEKPVQCIIDEVPSIMKMFEWCGISFGEQETYRIYKAMKRLGVMSGATNLRLWGKFLGRKRDYYVLEGQLPFVEEVKSSSSVEDRGIGVNSHVYWVTDDLLSDWIQLPEAEPKYIEAARSIKYIVSGDLNAKVNSNPKFPGKERHFLRAQIARIAHSTTIIPKDFMIPHEEDEKEVVFNEEFGGVPQNAADMKSIENWWYAYQEILPGGVTSKPNPEDPEAFIFTERLKGLTEDKKVHKDLEGAWMTKIKGSQQQYASGEEGNISHAWWEIKSLRWKGALTVTQNGRWASLYVGFGIKTGGVCFNPTTPEAILDDPPEDYEQPEPTPFEEPPQPEEALKEGEGDGASNDGGDE